MADRDTWKSVVVSWKKFVFPVGTMDAIQTLPVPRQSFFAAYIVLSLTFISIATHSRAADISIISPNGKLSLTVKYENMRIGVAVSHKGREFFRSGPLGFILNGNDTLSEFRWTAADSTVVRSEYAMPWGVAASFMDNYRELVMTTIAVKDSLPMVFRFRAYDDGVAYRYESVFPGDSMLILAESGDFEFASVSKCWWSWADYNTLEKEIYCTPVSEARHVSLPFTMLVDSSLYVSVLEAAVDDYTTMTLKQRGESPLSFGINLVPWADGIAVRVADRLRSPWRAMIITDSPEQLLASHLVMDLNDPPKKDFAWARPIKYAGVWWEMHLGLSTWKKEGGRHGATNSNVMKYIDFAAANHLDGVLVEGWNTGWEQWGEKGAFDFTTPYEDFDLKGLAEYASFRNVRLIGHHETGGDIIAYESRIDSAFALYKKLGIRYVKTGYAGPVNPPTEHHHGQYMVRHMNRVMCKAAEYGMILDVHEPVIPSGLGRTYPNLMTFEGVRGMEWNAWSAGNPPSHTCTAPFTRGLAGPMDYTPGIFDTREDNFKADRKSWNGLDKGNNSVHATLSNQLALMVINYSPMQMAADLPQNYTGHPAFDFIRNLPSTWDESRVVAASIGEYIVIARRKGTTWYLAGITNEYSRSIQIPTGFLSAGAAYSVDACTDTPSSHYENDPESYSIRRGQIRSGEEFQVWMAPGGGELVVFSRSSSSK